MATTGRPCSICRHADRAAIDRALIGQEGFADISRRFAVSQDALARHSEKHVPTSEMKAGAEAAIAAEGLHGAGLMKGAADLRDKAFGLLRKAEDAGDLRTALAGVREAARCLELLAKLTGELDESATVNLVLAPQWVTLQTTILEALAPHPEARAAVAAAMARLG